MKMLEQVAISYDISKLKPVISEKCFDLHFNKIYKKYVDRFNKGDGDFAFDKAGAFLHNLYFENLREYRINNTPTGKSFSLIELRYGSYERFVQTILDKAKNIQGNGWVFMNTSGYVNLIPNNRIVDNVAMIIDCWEHSYILNYGDDIETYVKNHLNILNWDVINNRMLKKD